MTDHTRAVAVLIAVFLLGCLVGGAGFYFWSPRVDVPGPGPFQFAGRPPRPLNELLKLSPEQEVKFREIMGESRKKIDSAMSANAPRLEAIRAEMHRQVLAILNDEQKQKFEAFTAEFERRRERRPPPF
jgi:Spy/CpxP family protein refolding chaperone